MYVWARLNDHLRPSGRQAASSFFASSHMHRERERERQRELPLKVRRLCRKPTKQERETPIPQRLVTYYTTCEFLCACKVSSSSISSCTLLWIAPTVHVCPSVRLSYRISKTSDATNFLVVYSDRAHRVGVQALIADSRHALVWLIGTPKVLTQKMVFRAYKEVCCRFIYQLIALDETSRLVS